MSFTHQSPLTFLCLAAACLASGSCSSFDLRPGTPLAIAAHRGDLAEIRQLAAAGANPNEFDATGQTPLHWAARGGHPLGPHDCRSEATEHTAVVAALLDLGADVNAVDRRVPTPGAATGWTPLHVALQHGQFATAELLLHRGANPDIRTGQGKTTVAIASERGAPKPLLARIMSLQ